MSALFMRGTVDRNHLLEVADTLTATTGAAALTFGSLAEAAGLSKATVQKIFVTRKGLIGAMLDRWQTLESARFQALAVAHPDARQRVRAHIAATAVEPHVSNTRVASMLAAIAGT